MAGMEFWSAEILLLVAGAFLVSGTVKGVVGIGLPTTSLALLSTVINFQQAVAIILLPAIATNLWQALAGGAFSEILRRTWPLLFAVLVGIWFGVDVMAATDGDILKGILGVLVILYAVMTLAAPPLPPPGRADGLLQPVVGALNGFVTGLTGTLGMPGVLYLDALRLPRDVFVQAMGVLFTVSAVAFGVALTVYGIFHMKAGGLSALALLPAFAGMWAGRRLRQGLPEATFRRLFLAALMALGGWLVWRGFFA